MAQQLSKVKNTSTKKNSSEKHRVTLNKNIKFQNFLIVQKIVPENVSPYLLLATNTTVQAMVTSRSRGTS